MRKYFAPEPDITAYEVALVISHVGGVHGEPLWKREITFTEVMWAEIGELQRHFKDKPSPSFASIEP